MRAGKVSLILLPLLLTALPAAAADAPDPSTLIAQYERLSVSGTWSLDPVTGQVTESPLQVEAVDINPAGIFTPVAEPQTVASETDAPSLELASTATPTGESYGCIRHGNNANLTIYTPKYVSANNNKYYMQFIYHKYMITNARQFANGTWTRQFEWCTAGGGSTKNGYHTKTVGSTVTTNTSTPRIVGWKWGTTTVDSTVSATLGFKVGDPKGVVNLDGSVQVHPRDTYTGTQGPWSAASDSANGYPQNEVSTYYQCGCPWNYSGSSDYQGNVGHGLWEWPMSDTTTKAFPHTATIVGFCSHPYGINCG